MLKFKKSEGIRREKTQKPQKRPKTRAESRAGCRWESGKTEKWAGDRRSITSPFCSFCDFCVLSRRIIPDPPFLPRQIFGMAKDRPTPGKRQTRQSQSPHRHPHSGRQSRADEVVAGVKKALVVERLSLCSWREVIPPRRFECI